MTEPPLGELLVVELGRQAAVSYCCLLFRYLGATVVKVEPPDGDAAKGKPSLHLNAGKKSMTLDVARAEGAALLCRLVEKSDVLVVDDALPPDLDYAALSRQNPRLIMTCVTETLPSDEAQRFIGLNAFAATLLPLITMSVLGRGQRIEVDGEECLAAAAMIVDDGEMHAAQVEKPLEMAPPRLPFSVDGVAPLGPVPLPGEDNDEVYCELLGLTGEELARLRREAIV